MRFLLFFFLFTSTFSLQIIDNSIVDEFGKRIPVKEYNRIVVYNLGAVEILDKIGAGDKIVAIPKHNKDVLIKNKNIASLSSISKPSLEEILRYKPDLVIFNIMGNISEDLKTFNIPSITFRSKNLNEIIENISILGLLTNKKEEADSLAKILTLKLHQIKKIKKPKTAILLHSLSPLSSFSKDSLPVEIMERLGIEVFAPPMKKYSIISSEYILRHNPDFIIGTRGIKNTKDIIDNIQLIKECNAYKNNQIIIINSELIMRGSHRVFDEIDKISKIFK